MSTTRREQDPSVWDGASQGVRRTRHSVALWQHSIVLGTCKPGGTIAAYRRPCTMTPPSLRNTLRFVLFMLLVPAFGNAQPAPNVAAGTPLVHLDAEGEGYSIEREEHPGRLCDLPCDLPMPSLRQ